MFDQRQRATTYVRLALFAGFTYLVAQLVPVQPLKTILLAIVLLTALIFFGLRIFFPYHPVAKRRYSGGEAFLIFGSVGAVVLFIFFLTQ